MAEAAVRAGLEAAARTATEAAARTRAEAAMAIEAELDAEGAAPARPVRRGLPGSQPAAIRAAAVRLAAAGRRLAALVLPAAGVGAVLLAWAAVSQTIAPDLPSPWRTWQESKPYVLDPFFKDGEMNQGVGRLAFYSLVRVGKGYLLAVLIGTPLGFVLGLSARFRGAFDPLIQFLRPISPLAWLPLGLVIFQRSEPAAVFTIALCAMWPTVINTAVGVRSINPDYLNVGRVLALSRTKTLVKIVIPATLPYVFTGYRLSLGIAWLVIVASEMLTGAPGIGGFLWQEYNSLVYSHIILSILTIGLIGFLLDRLMGLVEAQFRSA